MIAVNEDPVMILDSRHNLGECVLWDERKKLLFWIDIHARNIYSWNLSRSCEPNVITLQDRIGAIALSDGDNVVAALTDRFVSVDLRSKEVTLLAILPEHKPRVRLNDGRVDPAGRFICGGMHEGTPQLPLASLWSFTGAVLVNRLFGGIHCTNSLCWSPDGRTMYFTDMPSRRIDAFDYDVATGAVDQKRLFADLSKEPGLPDGSAVDAEGFVWNAQWGGNKLVRYARDGSVDREVALPVTNPTCVAFGGEDMDVLFVTSAWFGLSEEQRKREPEAGGLFAFKPGVRGCAESRYLGTRAGSDETANSDRGKHVQ